MGDQFPKQLFVRAGLCGEGILALHPLACGPSHRQSPRSIGHDLDNRSSERRWIAGGNESTRDTILDNLRRSTDTRGHRCDPRGARLQQNVGQAFGIGRKHDQIRIRNQSVQIRDEAAQLELIMQLILTDHTFHFNSLWSVSEMQESHVRMAFADFVRCLNQNVEAFFRTEPPG